MIKVDVKNRWTGEVKFTADIHADENTPFGLKLGLAVKWAVSNAADLTDANLTRANLTRANLTDADLTAADLTDANLTRANLTRANLTDADLTDANLTDADLTAANLTRANLTRANLTAADLTDANLTDADLTRADLTDANLTRANLTRANLTRADLTDANLTRANLTDANLTDADLTDANLTDANLTRANLTPFRDDLWAVLSSNPAEVEGLRSAIVEGRIDGSTYSGECACLSGTLANCAANAGRTFDKSLRNSSRPIERFFIGIRIGDTPATSQFSKLALEWTDTWLAKVKAAFDPAK